MTSLINFFTGGWQGTLVAALIGALIAGGGTYYVTSLGYRVTIAQMQRDQANANVTAANAALKQFTAQVAVINGAAASFGTVRDDLDAKINSISTGFKTIVQAAPLPPDCKPDAVRLHSLSAAIAAANSAAGAQSGTAMPPHP